MTPRTTATDRVGRILSLVPWIAAQDGADIDDVCEQFAITRKQLEDDLNAILVVGLHPYTPGDYIDVHWDGDDLAESTRVWIGFTNFFERPLRLTLHETLALLAAGVAARDQPGHDPDGPLERGLAKLAANVGVDIDGDLLVRVSSVEAQTHAELAAAIEARRVVRVTYYSHARDETTERDLEPRRLFTSAGAAYLDAYCRTSHDDRIFRLDRVQAIAVLDDTFEPTPEQDIPDDAVFVPDEQTARVVLDVPARDRWVVEAYPTERVEERDDRLLITLAVAAKPWLERLLLRLGPDTTVVDGPDDLRTAGVDAARRILAAFGR